MDFHPAFFVFFWIGIALCELEGEKWKLRQGRLVLLEVQQSGVFRGNSDPLLY